MSILMLDREVDPQSEDFITRREEGVMNRNMGGVEIARPYYRLRRHLDDETTTSQSDSFLGSRDSMSGSEMTGYYSSSQAPDYESSMQDDYDGGESAYSQQIYRLRTSGLVGEMSVVSQSLFHCPHCSRIIVGGAESRGTYSTRSKAECCMCLETRLKYDCLHDAL